MRFLQWVQSWFVRNGPQSLFELIRKRPRPEKLKNLYILNTDFPVSLEKLESISQSLEPYRKKYSIDFIVLEPGISLKRFDEI